MFSHSMLNATIAEFFNSHLNTSSNISSWAGFTFPIEEPHSAGGFGSFEPPLLPNPEAFVFAPNPPSPNHLTTFDTTAANDLAHGAMLPLHGDTSLVQIEQQQASADLGQLSNITQHHSITERRGLDFIQSLVGVIGPGRLVPITPPRQPPTHASPPSQSALAHTQAMDIETVIVLGGIDGAAPTIATNVHVPFNPDVGMLLTALQAHPSALGSRLSHTLGIDRSGHLMFGVSNQAREVSDPNWCSVLSGFQELGKLTEVWFHRVRSATMNSHLEEVLSALSITNIGGLKIYVIYVYMAEVCVPFCLTFIISSHASFLVKLSSAAKSLQPTTLPLPIHTVCPLSLCLPTLKHCHA